MPFHTVCPKDAVSEGGMGLFTASRTRVLLVWPKGGELKAYRGRCPHKDVEFDDRTKFDGKTVTCAVDEWGFNATTGKCSTRIAEEKLEPFALRLQGDTIQVDVGWERPVSNRA